MTKQEEIREDLTLLISECYSKEGSACKLHPVFQPQKFLNKLFPYLHSQDVVIVDMRPKGDLTGCTIARIEPLIEE